MKKFDVTMGLIAVIVILLFVAVAQSNTIVRQAERLRAIEIMARHEQTVNPWVLIELIAGVE